MKLLTIKKGVYKMESTIENSTNILNALFHLFNVEETVINDKAAIKKSSFNSVPTQRELKKSIIVALVVFLGSATETEFQEIFGESLGLHLWAKFYSNSKYNYNFLNEVSNHNLTILEEYLKKEVM